MARFNLNKMRKSTLFAWSIKENMQWKWNIRWWYGFWKGISEWGCESTVSSITHIKAADYSYEGSDFAFFGT